MKLSKNLLILVMAILLGPLLFTYCQLPVSPTPKPLPTSTPPQPLWVSPQPATVSSAPISTPTASIPPSANKPTPPFPRCWWGVRPTDSSGLIGYIDGRGPELQVWADWLKANPEDLQWGWDEYRKSNVSTKPSGPI